MTLYYVLGESEDGHEGGSDEKGDGSFEKPWATHAYALEQVYKIGNAPTGDVVFSLESDVNNAKAS